ncbi:MAG TPA: hypothetical protein DCZ72_06265 [Armatimonadetes bacterium]|nr:hypothetical protein [Armatimonadota bacterium]
MRDEGLSLAHGTLNVARAADQETIEATFARLYKAARRQAQGGDQRRQELNAALETLTNPDRRAAAELEAFWVPLERTAALPTPESLAGELLPLSLEVSGELEQQVWLDTPIDLARRAQEGLDEPAEPSAEMVLEQLAARLALEQWNPWAEG